MLLMIVIGNIKINSDIISDLILYWKKFAKNNGTDFNEGDIRVILKKTPEPALQWLKDNSEALYKSYLNGEKLDLSEIVKESPELYDVFNTVLFPGSLESTTTTNGREQRR